MTIKVTKTKITALYYDTDDVIEEAKEWGWYESIEHCKTKEDWIKWFEQCDSEDLPETYRDFDYDFTIKAE